MGRNDADQSSVLIALAYQPVLGGGVLHVQQDCSSVYVPQELAAAANSKVAGGRLFYCLICSSSGARSALLNGLTQWAHIEAIENNSAYNPRVMQLAVDSRRQRGCGACKRLSTKGYSHV